MHALAKSLAACFCRCNRRATSIKSANAYGICTSASVAINIETQALAGYSEQKCLKNLASAREPLIKWHGQAELPSQGIQVPKDDTLSFHYIL